MWRKNRLLPDSRESSIYRRTGHFSASCQRSSAISRTTLQRPANLFCGWRRRAASVRGPKLRRDTQLRCIRARRRSQLRAAGVLQSAETRRASVCCIPTVLWATRASSRLHYDSAISTSHLLAFGVGASRQLNTGRAAGAQRPAAARAEAVVLRSRGITALERHNRARLSETHRQTAFRNRTVEISSVWLG